MTSKRYTRTGRHFTRRDCVDGVYSADEVLHLPPWRRHRLSFYSTTKELLDAAGLADALHRRPLNTSVFIDNSLVDERTDPRIWEALLDRPRGVTIVPSVDCELSDWRDRHGTHPLAQAISLRDTAVELWKDDAGPDVHRDVFWFYLHLLALRGRAYSVAEWQLAERSSLAPDLLSEKDVSRTVQSQLGERGLLLGKKGRAAVGRPKLCTDEKLVAGAVLHGLTTGNLTIILTKDEDVQEQFYKCCWLIDTQYRGFLLARRFAEQPDAYQTTPLRIPVPQEHDFFEAGDHLLLHRRTTHLQEVLPTLFNPVELSCVLAGVFHSRLSFTAEREMNGLLEAKAVTGGLNTELLNGRNCHVWVPITNRSVPHGYAAIGYDRRKSLPHTNARISLMDANLAVLTNERFGRPYRSRS